MDNKPFDLPGFFPAEVLQRITDIRVNEPGIVTHRAERRQRPDSWVKSSGNTVILAADHPARSVTKAAGDDYVMGNRHSYLGRLVRVLASPWCDGILGTPDIMEDLLIIDHLLVESGGASLLDGRIMVGTMNRGGLAGAQFEMDDTFTAYTVDQIVDSGLDAAKAMFRLDDTNPDSLKTLTACATAVDACVDRGIPMYLEALPVVRSEDAYSVVKTSEALMKIVGIASGIGKSSLSTWIKIPYCEGYEAVAGATTCPILMLGGESSGDPSRIFHEFESGMAAGQNVRGALVGRNVHHPGTHDPAAIAAAVYEVVHSGMKAVDAAGVIERETASNLDALTRVL